MKRLPGVNPTFERYAVVIAAGFFSINLCVAVFALNAIRHVMALQANSRITLPAERPTRLVGPRVKITSDDRIFYNDQPVTIEQLKGLIPANHDGLVVQADPKCRYPFLHDLFKTLGDSHPGLNVTFSVAKVDAD